MGSRRQCKILSFAKQTRLPSYILAITAHGRCKQWQEAIDTFLSITQGSQVKDVNVYIYNATISACEKMLEMFIAPGVGC